MHLAKEHDLEDKFAASPTWVKLFLRRHRLSLRTQSRQGQTTPEDARQAAKSPHHCIEDDRGEKVYPTVFLEYVPKQTISKRGVKTVWVKCSNKDQLLHEIDRARKELVQKEADIEVERLRALLTEEPFILTPPNRGDISEWISTSWGDLSIDTIVSGFAKVGILADTRVAEAMPTEDAPQIESCIVEELENCNLVDGEFGSDDDIENESDSDDESNL
ncbi:unnamed protein product [Phytophthora fragariaefolia]|uniref:Unnamed protein product n=1 Tax=Phytophthora fragariaefolia TaxID=1490495 RepID=A0A9W6Y6T5_9STRA|nr:unnamed protein product [Phytophthora fragariaefolia]